MAQTPEEKAKADKDAKKASDEARKDEEAKLPILERIRKEREKLVKLQEKGTELTSEESDELDKTEVKIAKLVSQQEKRYKKSVMLNQSEKELASVFSSHASELSSISTIYKGLTDVQKQSLNVVQSILDPIKQSLLADEDKKEILDSTITGVTDLQKLQQKLAETGPDDLEIQQSINDSYLSQLNKLQTNIFAKQQIGQITEEEAKVLMDILKTQKQSLIIAQKHATISGHTKDFLQTQINAYKGIEKTIRGTINTAKVLSSTVGGAVGAAFIGVGLAAEELFKSVQKTGGFLGEFSLSAAGLGVLFDDAQSVAEGLATQLGSTEEASFGTQLNVNLMAKNLGLSGEEASNLIGSFSRLNGNSTDIALDMMTSAKETAKLGGVIPSKVMGDLAASADAFATYSKEGGQNIVKAAVYARQLGISFDKLSSVADGLLDFETSITKELELGAMLGRNINLNEARRLAYAGDLEGMGREILNQMGGIAAFNDMDVFQKKAAADALGVSVSELQTMLANAEKATGEVSLLESGFNSVYESVTAISTSIGGKLVKGLGTGLIAIGQMGTGLGAINDATGGMVSKSAEFVKNLIKAGASKVFGMFGGGDVLSKAQKTLSDKQISAGFGGKKAKDMLDSKAKGTLGSISDTVSKTESDGGTVGKSSEKSGGGLKSLADGLKEMGNTKVLAGALNLIPTAIGLVAMIAGIPSLLAIAAVGVPAGTGLKALATGLQSLGKAGLAALKGIALLGLFGVALIPLTYALSLLAPLVESIGKGIGSMIESIGKGIATIVTSIGDLFVKILPLLNLEAALGILAIASAFTLLAGSLLAFSVAGLVALPAMLAVGTFAGLGLIGGGGDEAGGGTGDAKMDELITEIRGLRSDLNSGKIGVNMDGRKVTAAVNRVVDKVGTNSYGLG